MEQEIKVFEPVEHISVWLDGGIMLKTNDPYGDPVEMGEEEALALANFLIALVAEQRGKID